MIRTFAALLCLGAGSVSAQTLNYESPAPSAHTTLTPENVLWTAFLLDEHADPAARAVDYLKVREPQRYASNMHDPAAVAAEAKVVEAEIAERLKTVDRSGRFVTDVTANTDRVEGREVFLATPFDAGFHYVETNFGSNSRYLPPLYELLIANNAHFASFTVDAGVATEYKTLFNQFGPSAAYLRVELELVSVHQGHRFQTIIRNIKWFRDWQQTKLIAEKSDDRPAKQLIAERLLSEGVTLDAAPEHAFTVSDERMLEILIQNHPRKARTCADDGRIKGHRIVLCQWDRPYIPGVESRTEYRYVGGRLVDVSVFHTGKQPVDDTQRAEIFRIAKYDHNGPGAPQDHGVTEWTFGTTNFRYNPDATRKLGVLEPYYQATSQIYLDLQAGKPGTEVDP